LRLTGEPSIAAAMRYHARRPGRPLQTISHQIWFCAKLFQGYQRQVPQPGGLGAADAVLAPGPPPVP
jgi:hypothetical protein